MAIEKKWESISPRSFTADGTTSGIITIPTTSGFKVKQEVYLASNSQDTIQLQVKRVKSSTELIVGHKGKPLNQPADVSSYLVSDNANIYAMEQSRPDIPLQEHERAVYEEEPTVAKRSVLVDEFGNKYSDSNPLPVQLSDGSINIGTVNAELEVQLSHKDNTPNSGDIADSVRIGDGVDELKINPDGSLNVSIVQGASLELKSVFNDISAIPNSTPSTIVSHAAAIGKSTFLNRIYTSGENIATYLVRLNGTIIDKKRTYFGSSLDCVFDFSTGANAGLQLAPGDIVLVEVEHFRPDVGDFNGRIQVLEV